jgi:hypothetical protein
MFLATDDIKASLQQSARTFVEDIVNIIISGLQNHKYIDGCIRKSIVL